jgi:hypothetical protein
MGEPTELHEQLVDAANEIYGSHRGARAFHAARSPAYTVSVNRRA